MFWSSRRASREQHELKRLRRRSRRGFEHLEDRRLLANYNVTTTLDVVDDFDGKLSLREAINLANDSVGVADVITLKAGTYKITISGGGEDANETGDFDILDDLTIKYSGRGSAVIDGNGFDRVFNIPTGFDGVDLTLNNVTVTGGIARTPGSGKGGGVAGESDNNTITLLNASVVRNISTSPAGATGGVGGGIFNKSGNINLTYSHVDQNSAAAGVNGVGGGIYLEDGPGVITIKNSTVNNNSAYNQAGGIWSDSAAAFTMIGSQLNNNHSGEDGGGGATLSSLDVTITSSSVSGNTTLGVGGGLYMAFQSLLKINKSTFANNSATASGGGVFAPGSETTVWGSTFKDNTSTLASGGGLVCAAVEVKDSVFNHNLAQGAGGAISQGISGDITILRSTFTRNLANNIESDVGGGAIFANGGANLIDIKDSKFTFNTAIGNGGAIAANGNTVEALRSKFENNTSVNGFGGAIDMGDIAATFRFTDSYFTYNTAKADGGAFNSQGGDIEIICCVISYNTVTNGQGGGFTDGSGANNVTIKDCTISNNTAGGDGGGFFVTPDVFSITGSTVDNNRSGSNGGGAAIVNNGTSAEIINSTFSGNGAQNTGGGIDYVGNTDITITNATIAFNAARVGGGISHSGGIGQIRMGNTIVAKNTATDAPDFNAPTGSFNSQGHNLFFSTLGIEDGIGGTDIVGDPKLGPLADNGGKTKTHALLKGSPAIDAGDNSLAPDTDQRGVSRPQPPGGIVDIGAYEYQAPKAKKPSNPWKPRRRW